MSRVIWLLTGVAWAARSLMEFAHPDYWDPVTALDWSSIWLYSAAWLLFAPSVLLLSGHTSARQVTIVAVVVAIGAIVAGGANAIEDGFGVPSLGALYVVGFMTAWIGLVPLARELDRVGQRRLAGLSVLLLVGVILLNVGGGLLILAGLGSMAVAPGWYRQRRPAPTLVGEASIT